MTLEAMSTYVQVWQVMGDAPAYLRGGWHRIRVGTGLPGQSPAHQPTRLGAHIPCQDTKDVGDDRYTLFVMGTTACSALRMGY